MHSSTQLHLDRLQLLQHPLLDRPHSFLQVMQESLRFLTLEADNGPISGASRWAARSSIGESAARFRRHHITVHCGIFCNHCDRTNPLSRSLLPLPLGIVLPRPGSAHAGLFLLVVQRCLPNGGLPHTVGLPFAAIVFFNSAERAVQRLELDRSRHTFRPYGSPAIGRDGG